MNESRAAVRYAKAVLDLALENKATEAVEADMRGIVQTISDSSELQTMLGSPIVKASDKKAALTTIFEQGHNITSGLVSMLVDNKRIGLLDEVAQKFIVLNEARKGEGVAYVTSAVPLTDELEKEILEKVKDITGNEVSIINKVDESLIGGFVLRVGDIQYDASIANKLNNIKREFSTNI